MYGKHGKEIKCVRGNHHEYLGMTLDFVAGKKRGVRRPRCDQVTDMVDGSTFNLSKCDAALAPA